MPEHNYNPQVKNRHAPKLTLEAKAEAQIAWWDQFDAEAPAIYYVYTCAVCKRRRSQKVLIYMVVLDEFFCSQDCIDKINFLQDNE